MKYLLKVTVAITLLPLLIAVSYSPTYAQNTAPVPSTFEILSPSMGTGSLPFLINSDYSTNKAIFFGGDFAYPTILAGEQAFVGWVDGDAGANALASVGETIARGNSNLSRLTLGGTDYNASLSSNFNSHYVANLPGTHQDFGSYDQDDVGGATGTYPDYHGTNGFIAINEEDSLVIRLTGYVDPNNHLVQLDAGVSYEGALFKSVSYAFDIANPKNDSANGARYGVIPSTLPPGASFNGGMLVWVPNFIQGDGTFDNSVRNNRFFVDANISNGTTTSQTSLGVDDTVLNAVNIGQGKGELRDSLYVVYFTATDDGIPPSTEADSLFILVNDSVANPPPHFTKRDIRLANGSTITWLKSSVQFTNDSLLTYSEGDSIVITFTATDQDSVRGGGANQTLAFGVLDWSKFLRRPTGHTDSLALRVDTVKVNNSPRALRVRLRVAYNVADTVGNGAKDTLRLVVSVDEASNSPVNDTILFFVNNINRPPIWDADTSSKPSDSALTWAFDAAAVEPDSIDAFPPIAVSNGLTDSVYFSQYAYDPDPLVHDSLGPAITFSSTSPLATVFSSSGVLVVTITREDTASFNFPISAMDTDPTDPKTATANLVLRVAPEPDVAEIYPPSGYPGQDITIFGTGFGLFDVNSITPSRVTFRSRNTGGSPQNFQATINSWGRDRINLTIPAQVSISAINFLTMQYVPDTIEIRSAVFNTPTFYPYVITEPDSLTVTDLEVVNISSSSAVIKWRTAFTGTDSVVVATAFDTLDVISTNGNANTVPVFIITGTFGTTNVPATTTTFKGATQTTDQVHYIEMKDLAPSTTYQLFIGMKNDFFYGDTARNINGPYKPAKINLAMTGNGPVRGFLFQTLPAQNNSGELFAVGGRAFTSGGAAIGAVVTVQIVDKDNVADTTLPLTATVSSDSAWLVNLGDAVIDTIGTTDRLYAHKAGDYLIITIAADKSVGFTQLVTDRAATSPQIVGGAGIQLSSSVNYDLRLKVGLNLIGIPVNLFNTQPKMAKALLSKITQGTPSITRYVTGNSTLETIIRTIAAGANQFIGANDWNLADANGNYYSGYFLAVDGLEYLTLSGSVYGDSLPPMEFQSAGLYWIARPAQSSSLFYPWNARTMLANIANSEAIYRYNEDTQNYENAIIDPLTGAFIGNSFHIDVSEGYVIQISAASQWDINTAASVMLANASQKFDYVNNVSPSLTLKASQTSTAGALRDLRLTNITSSAAKLTWFGDLTASTVVRYGKASEGLNHTAQYQRIADLQSGVGVLTLLGLEPETDYVYEIVSNGISYNNNGSPFAFSTAKIGIGMPYTVFGRLVDENGEPLKGAVVYLEAKRSDDRSLVISAVTDEKGYWNANLANLKAADGEVYLWKAGDEIGITAVYGDASRSFRTLVSGQSPQNIVRVDDTDGVASQDKKEVSPVALPKAFALGQNYPNPFNPSTTIAYDIPEEQVHGAQVSLKIYNVRGQVVRTLVDNLKEPGHYVVQWNGMDEHGETVASGVYFYRIKAGEYVATRKMVLLK